MYTGNDWDLYLSEEYSKPYFRKIEAFVSEEYRTKLVSPAKENIFKAFKYTDFNDVKCVILAQDPYPQIGVACGLAFSANTDVRIPKSLINIFKELGLDLGIPYPPHGNLTSWAKQGVLLLNSTLTVVVGDSNSHKSIGWTQFTNEAIRQLSAKREGIVFLLWGNFAKDKKYLIDTSKHMVLETSHPSPHAVHKGFAGCKHFSQVNNYLESKGKEPINWSIN